MIKEPTLRLLFLEDLESDFELATTELQRSGIQFESLRVENKEEFLKEVVEFQPDIIISDYMMPTFTGMEALKLALEFRPRIPFIILTGSMNEDTAVQCLRSGAADYVIKEHIARLPYSVREILEQKELNAKKEHAEKALVESEKAYRLLFDSNPQPAWVFEVSTQKFLAVNEAAIAKYGYSKEEFLSLRLTDLMLSVDLEAFQKFDAENPEKTRIAKKIRHQLKDGSLRLIEATSNRIDFEGKKARLVLVNDITEKVQAEEDLLRSEENFRQSIDESPLGIRIVSLDEKTIYANKAFLDIYQFSNLNEFNTTPAKERYTPESYTQYKDRKAERKAGFDVSKYELNIIRKDSEIRHVKVMRKEVAWNGTKHFQVINQDITEQKNAEDKLRKLSRAVEQSPNAIFITDTDAIIEYANPKTLELTGYTKEELIGQNPRIFSSGEKSNEAYTQLWNTIKAGNIWKGEMHNRKKSGVLYWESAIISPIFDNQGEITHFLAIKEDITADKKMLQDLIVAKEKAEESDRLKSAFLANMSHEIRTPMNGILGFSELLKEPGLKGEEQQKYIQIIEKSGMRMLNIIDDIVDISKIESGQMTLSVSETNVNDQIEYLSRFFETEIENKGLQLFHKCELPFKEAIVTTDHEKLFSILTNLVKNAIKFTNAGSIEFGYDCVHTGHTLSLPQKTFLQFYVKDTGIGIPADRQEAIFERFIHADISNKHAFQGAGLGLAISKAYIEMLGGKIWVESEELKGSTFYFTIPYQSETGKKALTKNSILPNVEEKKINKLKILIVEDDEASAKFVSLTINAFSKEIFMAKNGIEAVEACQNNTDIDLILMDIQMPEMNGYEATRQIRKFNPEVVIIAQTAFAMVGDSEKAIAAGCNDYISKPIKKAELIELILKYFRN